MKVKIEIDTKTAITVGKERQCVSERTVMNYLKELCRSRHSYFRRHKP